ncbi:DNA phosphorothioation-associated putative methyltransferase [Calothrix sp. PCC 6303]|uniref:DNA phosphorothioation-associated putative methyltransferase n=1 Tax=Calothrix sp. PCC 6303 TaxID=1170562 RepID=UPI0005A2C37F|nr:DNA phosphorothioation-associated putative methyltransferase [Calothrix sp. PCC 6303]
MSESFFDIERHRAAISRIDLSRPVKLAIEWEILTTNLTFFDYGCGYGGDVERTKKLGYESAGWDPYYFPQVERIPADVVNLGYVLNVIEDIEQRKESLCQAWKLTKKVLIVSAQVLVSAPSKSLIPYGDGVVTRLNTFQKYYQQEELKEYIDTTLNVQAVPVALGVYFVFRNEEERENYRALRYSSVIYTPSVVITTKRFADYEEILRSLMAFYTHRGRLPVKGELPNQGEILKEFGSFRRAFGVILQVTKEEEWDAIAYRRSLDIQVYLALCHSEGERSYYQLSSAMRHDIKAFFGDFEDACQVADAKLLSLGQPGVVKTACEKSKIGKHTRGALYVHTSALQELDPLLRIYEGCASRFLGSIEGATLIKFYTNEPRISYLSYPNFDDEPHPVLEASININLKTLWVVHTNYKERENPPILHRKETFVTEKYPRYQEFAQLTQQEQKLGLLKQKSEIGTRNGWLKCLATHGVEIRKHQVHPTQNL